MYTNNSITAIALSCTALLPLSCNLIQKKTAQESAPPNIIILLTDDQRWDAISYNNPDLAINTPHIDWLAKNGVNFADAFVTTPICAVSRASVISGRYSRNARIHEFLIPFDQDIWDTSYPVLMKNAGYYLGQIGKYGVGTTQEQINTFDMWDADLTQGPAFHEYNGEEVHDSEWLTLRTRDFLDQVPEGKPFVLQLNYKAPHPSAAVAPEDKGTLDGVFFPRLTADTPEQRALQPLHVTRGLGSHSYQNSNFSSDKTRSRFIANYLEKIISLDRSVGAIMKELKERGIADNTVVIFFSDHGTHFGEKGFIGKWTPYDPSLRIPFIVYDPRKRETAGTTSDKIVLNIDVAPTILDLAGLPSEPGMDGVSIMPLLRGESPSGWRRHFFFEHQMSMASIPRPVPRNMGVRTEIDKYARWTDITPFIEEYYDLVTDPHEMNNLFHEKPERAMELRRLFEQWEKENPNTYDYMPYSHRPQTGADIDLEKFKEAHPSAYRNIAAEVEKRKLNWEDILVDPELRWEVGLASGFFY